MCTQAYFWQGPNSALYRLDRIPEVVEQVMVFIPPLFEDANNIRHVYTKLANACVDQKIASVVFDFSGTGDSELALEQVSIANWQEELKAICHSVKQQFQSAKLILVACHSAALILTEDVSELIDKLVLWQPENSGKKYLKQLRRLMLLQGGDIPQQTSDEQELIAGYTISKQMLSDLSLCSLPIINGIEIQWFELCATDNLPPLREKLVDSYRSNNLFNMHILNCDKFWQATELIVPEELIAQTRQQLLERC